MSVTSALPREQAIARILELTGQPTTKGRKPWLVVTVGLPGSGKSTFSRKLAKATGASVLESDALRTALFGSPTHEKAESRLLFDALYGAAERLLAGSYDVAANAGAEVLVLHFHAPLSIIAERMSCRDKHDDPEDKSTAGMAIYNRMADTEEPLTRDHWRIDTSDAATTDAALQRAIEILKTTPQPARGPSTGGSIS